MSSSSQFTALSNSLSNTISPGLSNAVSPGTNIIFMFYDPFLPLEDIESPDDLKLSIARLFYPVDDLLFEKREPKFALKRTLSKGLKLLTEEDLKLYSEQAFIRQNQQGAPKRLEFSEEEKKHLSFGFEQWETKVIVSGGINLQTGYGWSLKDENFPNSPSGIPLGFNMNQNMRVNIVGKIGERVSVNINHSSDNPDNEYEIAYKALDADEGILRELRAGNISLNIPQSSYFVKYDGTSKDSYGLKAVFKAGDVDIQTVLSLTKSLRGYKKFIGNRQEQRFELQDVSYVKRKYYLLPDTQIDYGSLELLSSTSLTNLATRRIDSHYFIRLIEGKDYFINNNTGELTLTNTLDRNTDLVVKYTRSGMMFTTNSLSIVGQDDNTGEKFLYLWKAVMNFSPYIHYGYYSLPYRNFDTTRGFSLTVVYTADKSKLSDLQFSSYDYLISSLNGTIQFKNKLPFPDLNGSIYSNANDPSSIDSVNTMVIVLFNEVGTYQLDFGIIGGTERVYVNGRLLSPSEYTLVYSLGELVFNNSAIINENDTIEVYYEYKPFWAGSQKFSIAARMDYKPSNIFNLGSTLVYNIAQRDVGAPHIEATPEGVFMSDLDGTLNIARALKLPDDFEFTLKGEYALSVVDPNIAGYAIIEDFENSGESFGFSKTENNWILCSPCTNIPGIYYTNRGQLLYKDYRAYNLDGSYSMLYYSAYLSPDKIKDYSFKPGPYMTLGGHLNSALYPDVNQSSLVFDYDFRQGGDWVGAVLPIAGSSGIDLSLYNQISVWAYLQSDSAGDNNYSDDTGASVDLYVVAGTLNEDSDGDGILEGEVDRSQPGYDFHNYLNKSIVETKVGRGRLGEGDGYEQSEDINRNGVLDTNEDVVVFPGIEGYTDITNASVNGGGWQKITINIQSLSQSQIAALEHSSALAVYIKKKNGLKGRVIIDTLEFKKVNWNEKRIDGFSADDSKVFSAEILSVLNNPFYSANRFYRVQSGDSSVQARADIFEKLHGPKTIAEANQYDEKAMALIYHLSNTGYDTNSSSGGTSAVLVKRNLVAYDISQYHYLNYYIYIPDTDENGDALKITGDTYSNENFIFVVGSSDNSYYKWRIPLSSIAKNKWIPVQIKISEGLLMEVDGNQIGGYEKPVSVGYPNLIDVNFLEIGVELSSTNEPVNNGIIWVNEMYTSSDVNKIGTAYYINPVIEYKKPLFSVGDIEILGPLSLKGTYENRDLNFISAEGATTGSYNNNLSIAYLSSVLKDVNYGISMSENNQGTATNIIQMPLYLQWNSTRQTYNHSISYGGKNFMPTISHSFTESFDYLLSRNLVNSSSNDSIIGLLNNQYSSSAKLDLSQNLNILSLFVITPRVGFEDSYYLIDNSSFTNEEDKSYLTNSGAYGMKDLKKTLLSGLGLSIWVLNLSGEYTHSEEKYDKVLDSAGYRKDIEDLKQLSMFERYYQRLRSASEGFYFVDEKFDMQNSDSYSIIFSGDRPVSLFSWWLNDKIGRNAQEYNYQSDGSLYSRLEMYNLLSDFKLSIYPKFIIDTFIFKIRRTLGTSYTSAVQSIYYTNILNSFGRIYYDQPFNYSDLFSGTAGRTNSLNLVKEYSAPDYNSVVNYNDYLEFELNLPEMKNVLDTFVPKRYFLSTSLSTSRNLSSYSQSHENLFLLSFPIKISEWGINDPANQAFRIGDITIDLSTKNDVNFNDRSVINTVAAGISEPFFFSTNANLLIKYSLAYSSEDYLQNAEEFEKDYGFTVDATNYSPMQKYSHTAGIVYNWLIPNVKEVNLLLFKIKLAGYTVNNQEGLTYTADSISYQGYRFIQFTQKIYEITLDHNTQFQFSDFVKGGIILKAVFNQYAEITPLDNSIKTSYFKPGFGFLAAIDVKITF